MSMATQVTLCYIHNFTWLKFVCLHLLVISSVSASQYEGQSSTVNVCHDCPGGVSDIRISNTRAHVLLRCVS